MQTLGYTPQLIGWQVLVHFVVGCLLMLSPLRSSWGIWVVFIGPFVGAWIASFRIRRRWGALPRHELKELSIVSAVLHAVIGGGLAALFAAVSDSAPALGALVASAVAVGVLLGGLSLILTLCGLDAGNAVRTSAPPQ